MLQDFFKDGRLEMPSEAGEAVNLTEVWSDCLANRLGLVVFALLILIGLGEILRILPRVRDCIRLWRANLGLEHSLSTARTRDNAALILLFGWLLAADRFALYPAQWMQELDYGWSWAALAGVCAAYLILRRLCFLIMRPSRANTEEQRAARNAMFTYFIPLSIVMLLSGGLLAFAGVDDSLIRNILWYELAAGWAFSIIMTAQILSGKVSFLLTFLYLCGLEFLPAGVLAATAILL